MTRLAPRLPTTSARKRLHRLADRLEQLADDVREDHELTLLAERQLEELERALGTLADRARRAGERGAP